MKYRRLVSLTDEEITFAMKDIFHCTEIYRILRYKKNNEIHVEAAIPFQDEIIRETVILEEDKLQAPWIDSWEEENKSNKKRDFIPLFLFLSDSQSSALLFHSFAFKEKNGWDYHIIFANRANIRRFL